MVEALKNYVSLDAATITSATYDPADAAGFKLVLNFKDGKTFTVTPGSVN